MTNPNETDFFDGVGGGSGAPGAVLKNVGDGVIGTIVEMFKRDYIPYENRKTREPAKNADGSNVQQLVVTLQTNHRNWENVSSVPKVDPADPNSAEKSPSDDDGKRAIFVPEGKNIQFAIGRAVQVAQAKFAVGGTLGVKITELRDTGKGNELKVHEAKYVAPSAGDAFFGDAPAASTPAPAAPAPVADPTPAPAAPAAPAPVAQQDPWATPSAPAAGGSEPPF